MSTEEKQKKHNKTLGTDNTKQQTKAISELAFCLQETNRIFVVTLLWQAGGSTHTTKRVLIE